MTKKDIFYQVEGLPDIKAVSFDTSLKLSNLKDKICEENELTEVSDFNIFLENEDEPLDLDWNVEKLGSMDVIKVHANRCRRITVNVRYNGKVDEKQFASSTTIGKIQNWATKSEKLQISQEEASELNVVVAGETKTREKGVHIGSLVKFPNDYITLDLVPKPKVQG